MNPLRIAVLISGTGSNLQALIDAREQDGLAIEIVHVISNRPAAAGLDKARRAGINVSVLEATGHASREAYDQALAELIDSHPVDLVVLAGFMRIIGAPVLQRFSDHMINLHPSLLPLYRGTNTYQRALDAGDKEHGASIHFVTAELDGGPVISQVRIPVKPDDDSNTLARRLAPLEHQLIVATVELFTRGLVKCADGQVYINESSISSPLQLRNDGHLAV